MTTSGIEPATFRFVTHHLNHCATAGPCLFMQEKFKYSDKLWPFIYHSILRLKSLTLQRYCVAFLHLSFCCSAVSGLCDLWRRGRRPHTSSAQYSAGRLHVPTISSQKGPLLIFKKRSPLFCP